MTYSPKEIALNTIPNSHLTNFNKELVGGNNQKWKNILEKAKQSPIEEIIHQQILEDKVKNYYGLNNKNFHPKFDPNYQKQYGLLDPKKLTFEEIRQHAIVHQGKD